MKILFPTINYKHAFSVVLLSWLLSSCSGDYSFDSNMKADGAIDYFSASRVNIYNSEKEFPAAFQFIGSVEGDDCQLAAHLAEPDPINARTKARLDAYKKNANAVIFTGCVEVENQFCTAQIVCYAKAYQVTEAKQDDEK